MIIASRPLQAAPVELLAGICYGAQYGGSTTAIIVFCVIGLYSLNSDTFEIYEAALACVFGYLLSRLNLPVAPLLLGFVLGPAVEGSFRRSRRGGAGWFPPPAATGPMQTRTGAAVSGGHMIEDRR